MKAVSKLPWPVLAAPFGLIAVGVLAACGTAPARTEAEPSTNQRPAQSASSTADPASLTREDSQGAVTVKITPLNLGNPTATLDFDVTLDTHSVDLSMDLTQLAVLRTDAGLEVQATAWPVGSGHHYEATLSFPAQTTEGRILLEGATRLTLILKNVDVPDRVFEWSLSK